MEKVYVLQRDGQKSLRFKGELIAEADDRLIGGRSKTRWTELKLYGSGEKYVLHKKFVTMWQGEENTNNVDIYLSRTSLFDDITDCGKDVSDLTKELFESAAKSCSLFKEQLIEDLE